MGSYCVECARLQRRTTQPGAAVQIALSQLDLDTSKQYFKFTALARTSSWCGDEARWQNSYQLLPTRIGPGVCSVAHQPRPDAGRDRLLRSHKALQSRSFSHFRPAGSAAGRGNDLRDQAARCIPHRRERGARYDRMELGLFRTDSTGEIFSVPSDIISVGFSQNVGYTRRQGVETSVGYRDDKCKRASITVSSMPLFRASLH